MYKTGIEWFSQLYQQNDEQKNVYRQQITVSSDETGNTPERFRISIIHSEIIIPNLASRVKLVRYDGDRCQTMTSF